ncbi:hypothetical protein CHLRE_09g417013v5 [Chlamydomonas reinhardtii]|uniref:Uncharacterized protein n=1 Tax=Chlamydomonas reinhardtii TaxID=3055 RepID=A0A2K3DG16_CHLRE|nr:uncharacterized protein CHLRE_09g417013v5 [Chlamydomonas reinhardtii]PNW79484.1 hypothetical protein CHLRE_09g417013v5 [Chlamydomonas reinhardtii]
MTRPDPGGYAQARFGSTEHVAATVLEAQQAPPLLSKASLAVFTAAPGSPAITHSALCESRSHSTATSGSEPRSAVPSRQASLPAGGPPGNDTGADEVGRGQVRARVSVTA